MEPGVRATLSPPIPDLPGFTPERGGSTLLGHSASHSERLFLPLSGRRARVWNRYVSTRTFTQPTLESRFEFRCPGKVKHPL
jgi:hypothetical protein